MFGDEASNAISKIPSSNDSIRKRINMSKQNVNKCLLNTNFALQIDKFTNISGKVQLTGFIHDNKISYQFSFCIELIKHSKGKDIFEFFIHIFHFYVLS